ncbi:MAG: thioesterase family protein [Chitinophagales bacterium]|nr:thioesterase family protein [Chitinophagales bacterium]
MKRIHIDFPDKVLWKTEKEIAQQDINIAAHMGNDRILVWGDEIRKAYFTGIGWDKYEWFKDLGIIVANHSIIYKSEGFLGDKIGIELTVGNVTECSLDMFLRMRKLKENVDLIHLRTGLVCFDYGSRKIKNWPQKFLDIL